MSPIGLAMTSAPQSRPPSSVWSRLSGLALISLVVVSLRVVGMVDGVSVEGFLGLLLEGYFVLLPVLAAIAVQILGLRSRDRIAAVIGIATLLMVLVDFVPLQPGRTASRDLGLNGSRTAVELEAAPRWPSPGAIDRVVRCGMAGGCLGGFRDDAGRIQREGIVYGVAYFKVFFLLAPLIVVLTSAAAARWVDGAFVFMHDSAEWLVAALTTWILPLGMLFLVNFFVSQAFLRVLAQGWPPVALAYPYLGLLVLAGLSWQYLASTPAAAPVGREPR